MHVTFEREIIPKDECFEHVEMVAVEHPDGEVGIGTIL